MNLNSYVRAIWILLLSVCVFGDIIRKDNFFEGEFSNNHKGRMLRVLMVFNKLALDKCVVKCIQHVRCKTVNYNFEKEKCELTDVDFNDDEADKLSYDWYNIGTQPKVDGKWGAWQNASSCSATCGGGTMIQARDCDSPQPQHGGDDCVGKGERTIGCNSQPCPVNGNWSWWQNDTECNVTCGGGTMNQTRKCDSPEPKHGGKDCNGTRERLISCNNHVCKAVDGQWGAWRNDTSCTVTCGGEGTLRQKRLCDSPQPAQGGKDCNGEKVRTISCYTHSCTVHGNWGDWKITSMCNDNCDGGSFTKTRVCDNPKPQHGGEHCVGTGTVISFCNTNNCPVVNIALNKPSTQSGNSGSSRGNDGNIGTHSATQFRSTPWWQVDLQADVQVEYMIIRLTGEKGDVSVIGKTTNGKLYQTCKDPVKLYTNTVKFSCDSNQKFRFIKIERKVSGYLNVKEFEVYVKKN